MKRALTPHLIGEDIFFFLLKIFDLSCVAPHTGPPSVRSSLRNGFFWAVRFILRFASFFIRQHSMCDLSRTSPIEFSVMASQ